MGKETSSSSSSTTALPVRQPPAISIPPVPSKTYLHHTTLHPRPKLILIGDSITELGSSHAQGWATSLSIRYNRRMDVVNRGMNGYNSRWGMAALPLILEEILGPSAASSDGNDAAGDECAKGGSMPQEKKRHRTDSPNIDDCSNDERITTTAAKQAPQQHHQHPQYTFIIGYGANDSCLPDGAHSRHHVPLDEYASNLTRMIQIIQSWNSEKNVVVALLTPPPCDTEKQTKSRNNENVTVLYVEECDKVARNLGVPIVNLWKGMQLPAKNYDEKNSSFFESNQQWKIDYLSDGVHLTPMGNYRLYELVIEMLDQPSAGVVEKEKSGLGLAVSALPRAYPDHSLVDGSDPGKAFGTTDVA
eukprot:CAMPEP_0201607016 /NCGR_PEP_ID=MMETSP0492-20130828/6281_1 /ASSEMBLY_ACC=CAM_ASM_000837 /TAXON_ID=420259 /ORGANISM="Thalassiosira gravida, Strain GMp14c1" /LENGTH=359 /DNA_ID=CAMNT_0048071541 /DNA_START=201 /DNA_END=1280 /DNA_ORIENTATION=-